MNSWTDHLCVNSCRFQIFDEKKKNSASMKCSEAVQSLKKFKYLKPLSCFAFGLRNSVNHRLWAVVACVGHFGRLLRGRPGSFSDIGVGAVSSGWLRLWAMLSNSLHHFLVFLRVLFSQLSAF